jgi:hypothetical protein
MSEFKPMVKMTTDEPSVILKLKKGGKVASKKADSGKTMHKAMGGPSLMSALAGAKPMVGGSAPAMAAPAPKKPSMSARKRAMMADKMMATPMKKGGMSKHEDAAQDRAMIKKAMAGKKFANGGTVTGDMTKTTVPDSVSNKYEQTLMHGTPKGKTNGTTGDIKEKNGGGYKRGGKVMNKATGGSIPKESNKSPDKGTSINGGTIKGNAKDYLETQMHTAKPDRVSGTGGIKMANAGGYKTGGVAESNAGGYKKGGATKKAYATGGVVNTGKPVALFHGNVHSGPKTQNNWSGVYKKGGPVTTGNSIPNKRLKAVGDEKAADSVYDANVDSLYKYPQPIKTAKSGDNRASKKITPQYR